MGEVSGNFTFRGPAQVLEVMRHEFRGRSMTAYIARKPSVESLGATYISEHLQWMGTWFRALPGRICQAL